MMMDDADDDDDDDDDDATIFFDDFQELVNVIGSDLDLYYQGFGWCC